MPLPITPSQIQRFSIFRFIYRHIFLFLFLIFTLPIIISSISIAIKTSNYSYPAILLGESVLNSDNLIYKDVQILKTNPSELLGINPIGIYRSFIYYSHIFFYIWKMMGYIFCIIIPFLIFYFIFNLINSSTKAKNLILSGILGIAFIFVINLLITIIGLVNGSISLALNNQNQFMQILQVIRLTMPFHGIISLVIYLISLFI